MDKGTKNNFIKLDKSHGEQLSSKVDLETHKRKQEHYKILDNDEYAKIIKNF
jgi:hypothetical protein